MNAFEEIRALLELNGEPSGRELEYNIDSIRCLSDQFAEIFQFLRIKTSQSDLGIESYSIEYDITPNGFDVRTWRIKRIESVPLNIRPGSDEIAAGIHRSAGMFEKQLLELGIVVYHEHGPQNNPLALTKKIESCGVPDESNNIDGASRDAIIQPSADGYVLTNEDKALAILLKYPEITKTEIATRLGINVRQLHRGRMKKFGIAWDATRAKNGSNGAVDPNGRVDEIYHDKQSES